MAAVDQDLLLSSAAVAAAFEWERADAPESVRRRARVVLQAVSTGAIIAAGHGLVEHLGRLPALQLNPSFRGALEATEEFTILLQRPVAVDSTDPTLRLSVAR